MLFLEEAASVRSHFAVQHREPRACTEQVRLASRAAAPRAAGRCTREMLGSLLITGESGHFLYSQGLSKGQPSFPH